MTPPHSIKSHHSQKGAGVHQQLLTHPCLFFAPSWNYPPKSSKWIISFSTPRLSRRSSTVLAIMGGPQR